MLVMITRPEEDGAPFAAELRAHNVESVIAPMMTIVHRPGPPLDLRGVQALLATSANGVRAFAARNEQRDRLVCAVGNATAQAARDAGFPRVATAGGDATSLAKMVEDMLDPAAGELLHIAGSTVAGDLAAVLRDAGFSFRREVLYDARKASRLPEIAAARLREGVLDGVVFYSPRTARVFAELTQSAGLGGQCAALTAWCLSGAVAEQARALSWRRVVVADRIDGAAMVDAIAGAAGRAGKDFVSP